MAKPYEDRGVKPGKCAPLRLSKFRPSSPPAIGVYVGLVLAVASGQSLSQSTPQTLASQEQRRAEERDRAQREQLERTSDVRPQVAAPARLDRLPIEATCFQITLLTLKPAVSDLASAETGASTVNWDWALDAAAGPTQDDSPLKRCVGALGIDLVIKRLQDAVLARGFVTTRILAQPQDLSGGVLALTVVPGRIRAIRFAEPVDPRGTAWTAVPAKPGDVVNLRDIEQALENFKRVPTAEANIEIVPSDGPQARPGESDLLITYKQGLPLRLSLSVDDSGTQATGKYQSAISISYDNALTLNDLLYVTLSQDVGTGQGGSRKAQGTHGDTLHYSVPLGYWTVGATINHGRYFQTVAGIGQNYVYRGTNSSAEVKLSRLVYRDATRKTTLALKAFQRRSGNFIDDTEVEVQRRAVGGWEWGISHKEFLGQATIDANLAYKRGTGAFSAIAAPEEAFGEGTSRFAATSADVTLNVPFKLAQQSLRYSATWRGQYNHTPLTPQDRFAIGGRFSVRGFDGESALVAERGWLIRNDISLSLGDSGHTFYVGLDHGQVSGPGSGLLAGTKLTGAVVGLRGAFKNLQYDVFVGAPVRKPAFFRTATFATGASINLAF